jgi:uncharacterized repeat protein (TIGR01451 family)
MVMYTGLAIGFAVSRFAWAEPIIQITGPGVLDQAGATYLLMADVVAQGTAFTIGANDVTFDLNGHTVTYGEGGGVTIPNAGFEAGSGSAPSDWVCDPGVYRATDKAYSAMGYGGTYSLKFDTPTSPSVARSAWVTLTPGLTYIASVMVWYSLGTDADVYMEVEGIPDSRVGWIGSTTKRDVFLYLLKSFQAPSVPTQVRIVVGVDGSGLAVNTGSAWVDNAGLKPYQVYGIVGERNGFHLTNGTIIQGSGASWEGHAVKIGANGSEVDHLNVTVHGVNTCNIRGYWGGQFNIHDNVLTNNNHVVLNRHQGVDVISAMENSGGTTIHNNVIYGGPQFGIRVKAWAPYGAPAVGYRVFGNEIHADGGVPNSYGIAMLQGSDIEIYGNTIVPRVSGRGILLEGPQGAVVHDNYIEVQEAPTDESTWANGLRCRYGARDSRVYGNTIIARAHPGYTTAYAVKVTDDAGMNNHFYGNRIVATSDTPDIDAVAIDILEGSIQSGVAFEDNVVESNGCLVLFSSGGGARLARNTLQRLPGEGHYRTLQLLNYGKGDAVNNLFVDTVLADGADLGNAEFGLGTGMSFTVAWSVHVLVRDAAGMPLQGATVDITNSQGAQVAAGTTAADGWFVAELPEYEATSAAARTLFTPYAIRASEASHGESTLQLSPHQPTQVSFWLGSGLPPEERPWDPGASLVLTKTVDRTAAQPGEVCTYTLTYRNNSANTAQAVVLTDVLPAQLEYIAGSTRLNGLPVSPDPVSAGVLVLALGSVPPGYTGQVEFQVTVR